MRFFTSFFVCLFCIISSAVAQAPATTTQAPAAAATSSQQAAPAPAAASTTQAANSPVASNIPSAVASGNSTLAVNGSMIATAILPSGNSTNNSAAANSLAALPTSASYGNSVYPGTATFLTPTASKSVSPLYRIDNNENVTFVWQFTDLLVRPQNLTLAAVAPNSVTYTISAGLPGDTTSAVWQIKNVPAASPLMMGMYQVQLYDQRGPTAAPLPGWLMPVTRLTIAFYSAESYQPLTGSDYCPTCFYNAGRRVSESLGPIMIALGVASATSAMIIYGLLY